MKIATDLRMAAAGVISPCVQVLMHGDLLLLWIHYLFTYSSPALCMDSSSIVVEGFLLNGTGK